MADPLGRLNVGDAIPTQQTTWNAILDSARAHRAGGGRPQQGAIVGDVESTPSLTVRVRNDTSGALVSGSIVELSTPLISAVDFPLEVNEAPVFAAIVPTSSTCAYGVLLGPLAVGEEGEAAVSGVCVCEVSYTTGSEA